MKEWTEEHLQAISLANSQDELFAALTKTAKSLGFDYCTYAYHRPLPLTNPHIETLSNYPELWQKVYAERGYFLEDPTVKHCTRTVIPLYWDEKAHLQAEELWQEAASHGIEYGWSQSHKDMNGEASLFSVARGDEAVSQKELLEATPYLLWLTQLAHQGFSRLQQANTPTVKLTERETEILRWTAEGKTAEEISIILNITTRTVNFHIRNAMHQLNSTNKTSAAVKAAIMGLL